MTDAFDAFADRIPLVGILGFRPVDPPDSDGSLVRLAMEPRDDMLQTEDRVHGGILSTLADTTAVWALLGAQAPEGGMTSIEFKLNFLRPALADRGEVLAAASVVKRGQRIALVDVELEQSGDLVAKGLFTYLFTPPPS